MDEAWIENAIENYQRIERLTTDFDRALAAVEVSVRSPDGLVEVVVRGDGAIRDVVISDDARDVAPRALAKSVQAAVSSAADAAAWARQRLFRERFGDLPRLRER